MDGRRDELWARVDAQLAVWKDLRVCDIACGYGRFAGGFDPAKYDGIDFSDEMIKLAGQKYPGFRFHRADPLEAMPLTGPWDIVFEVNSLKSLGMKPEDFINKFKPYARIAVAVLEADEFRIENIYPV